MSYKGSPSGTDLIQTWPVFAARTETAWAAQKCHQLAVARQRGGFGRIIEVRKLRPKQGGRSLSLRVRRGHHSRVAAIKAQTPALPALPEARYIVERIISCERPTGQRRNKLC